MKVTWPAPAKLNLFLHIIKKRDDGYHELQSVMQFVSLADQLSFDLTRDGVISLVSHYQEVPPEDNLVYRAARLLQAQTATAYGATIELQKNIPVGAGMGGGSSDAASALLGLNRLWQTEMSIDALAELGKQLGADVPFFVRGHAAWVEGIGERLTPIDLPEPWYLLAIPDCTVPTAELYQDSELTRDCQPIRIQDYHFGDGVNVFTPVVCKHYPPVASALEWLSQFQTARMTGSGCVVFAAFDTEAEAGRIAALAPKDLRCIVTKGLNLSPLWASL